MSTIYALASGILPSGVAVIRVSGPQVSFVLENMIGFIPKARYMTLADIKGRDGQLLDKALVVYFSGPKSFTGEDSAEFHLHGGKALVNKFLEELSLFDNVRLAEAGEFSKRAFLNGKIDLTQAEGLADLISAETESQRRIALLESEGKLAKRYNEWREKIIKIRAFLEAQFDFSEEEEISSDLLTSVYSNITILSSAIKEYLELSERVSSLRDGLKIVLVGAPNSGKSSLINRLSGRDVAIVSNEAGTTRDSIEVRLQLAGLLVTIVDTAGLRENTSGDIESKGIEIAKNHLATADLVLFLEDMHDPVAVDLSFYDGLIWHIGNKSDKISDVSNDKIYDLTISAVSGKNIDLLLDKLRDYAIDKQGQLGDIVPARQRQRLILLEVCNLLDMVDLSDISRLEFHAEYLRQASYLLGRLTGAVDVEDLLDIIFSEFCIGK